MQKHKFYLAPLRGITDYAFRNLYEKHFGRFDCMLAPFIPTIRGNRVKDYHIRDVLPVINNNCIDNDTKRLIPQIIGHDAGGFLLLSRKFADLGFSSVNWNLGCPAPLITKKKRGCGLLPYPDIIKQFLDDIIPKLPIPLSIKTRLGLDNKDELGKLIPTLNDYPLKELIIHPRMGIQLYEGAVDIDKFEEYLYMSTHTVVYNGDIRTVDDFKYLAGRFPNVNNWMIGRGVIRNPFLLKELRDCIDESTSSPPTTIRLNDTIRNFLDDLLNTCNTHPNKPAVLGRMKEIWRYLGNGIDGTGALTESIIRCLTIAEYRELVASALLP